MICAGLKPNYRCRVPDCDLGDSTYSHGVLAPDGSAGLPSFYNVSSMALGDRCRRPLVSTTTSCENSSVTFGEEECAFKDLIFDRSVMRTTIVEEYQLVCGR